MAKELELNARRFFKASGWTAVALALASMSAPAMARPDGPPRAEAQQRSIHSNGGPRAPGNPYQGGKRGEMRNPGAFRSQASRTERPTPQVQPRREARPDMPRPSMRQPANDPVRATNPRPQNRPQTRPAVRNPEPSAQHGNRNDANINRDRAPGQVGANPWIAPRPGTSPSRERDRDNRKDAITRNNTPNWNRNDNSSGNRNNNPNWSRNHAGNPPARYDNRNWNRDWRKDNRYDWHRYRERNRNTYRIGYYHAPYSSYSYRRVGIGFTLGSLFYGQNYWISDPWYYRLPPVYGPYRWVRYYDDVLLVDIYSGEVVDVIHDFFW